MNEDEKIQDIAVAMIRRHSMNPEEWRYTSIGVLRSDIGERLPLSSGELVMVSAFFSDESWYAFTTRRIVSKFEGSVALLDPRCGFDSEFGNFKGYPRWNDTLLGSIPKATATLKNSDSTLRLEFETGKPSMAPIYATKYWSQKHPILHKLLTDAERESYKARNA